MKEQLDNTGKVIAKISTRQGKLQSILIVKKK